MVLNYKKYNPATNRIDCRIIDNIVTYMHYYSETDYQWQHTCMLLLLGGSVTSRTFTEDDLNDFTLNGAYRADYKYHPNFDQNVDVDTRIYITHYEHYFDEERKVGIHKFTKDDGTVFEEQEEAIGELIISTADF